MILSASDGILAKPKRTARRAINCSHDGEDFAVVDVQVDAADGMEDFSTEVEFDVEIFDREDQLIFLHRLSLLFIAGGSSGRQRPRKRCRSDRTQW